LSKFWNKKIRLSPGLVAGYKYFGDYEHPLNSCGHVYLHRHKMSIKLKRWLRPEEIVHHKDGNKLNNKLNNLQILTRSEHSKEHNPRGKKEKYCAHAPCSKLFYPWKDKNKYCSQECRGLDNRKVIRPPLSILLKELKSSNFCAMGRKYKVSDNAIRRWVKDKTVKRVGS
jgi:hypothetical protein